MAAERDMLLGLTDAELAARCAVEYFLGSGPGGQKRNKTATAVRTRLTAGGREFAAGDCSERSRARNLANALRKLRLLLALELRVLPPEPPERPACSLTHPDFPSWSARIFDRLEAEQFDHRRAAAALGVSPTGLLRSIAKSPELWTAFCRRRKELKLPELHP